MTSIKSGLCWAAAILFNALGNYLDLIDDKTSGTLFIVLPIVAVLSLRGMGGCSLWHRKRSA